MNILVLTMLLLLSGCATRLKVTYKSSPPGADIYEGNTHFGKTPLTLEYQVTEEIKKAGKLKTKPITAVWVSGAKSSLSEGLEIDVKENRYWSYTFQRPQSHPNSQMDITYGQNHERNMILREQHEIQQQQLYLQNLQYQEQQKKSQPRACYSDYECGGGGKCAKKEHENQGICVDVYYYNK